MPVRSIYAVDVDDAAFQQFYATFQKYQAAVNKLPAAWNNVNQAASAGKNVYADMAAAIMAQAEMLSRMNRETEAFFRHTTNASRSVGGIAKHTKDITTNLRSASTTLLGWTGLAALVPSLGAIGLDRLALSATSLRQQSLGLSVSPSELSGAQGYKGLLGNPTAILGRLADILSTSQGAGALIGAGLTPGSGQNAAQLMYPFLRNVQTIAKSGPEQYLGDRLQAHGLENVVPLELARTLRNIKPGELEEWAQLADKQRMAMQKITDSTLLDYAKFDTMLSLAWKQIEASFIVGLQPLIPSFTKLADAGATAITKLLDSISSSPEVKKGLDDFAKYIASDDFQKDVRSFVSGMADLASAVSSLVGFMNGQGFGAKAGIIGGAATGAAIGSIFGPGGAAIGGLAGAAIGGTAGALHQASGDISRRNTTSSLNGYGSVSGGTLGPGAYEAIARSEGTWVNGDIDWNMTASSGSVPGLSNMSLSDVMRYQTDAGGLQENWNSIADASKALGLNTSTTKFTPDIQKQIANYIYQKQGQTAWHGLTNHPQYIPQFQAGLMQGAAAGVGAYGVPGAVMNYGGTGALGAPGTNLVTIKSPGGVPFVVNRAAAQDFYDFLSDLEGRGYKIDPNSSGGYNQREKKGGSGWSEHAFGAAIDINSAANPYMSDKNNLPLNIHDIAASHRLIWGGDWKQPRDPMHFQWGGPGGQHVRIVQPSGITITATPDTGGQPPVTANQVAQ